MAHTIKLTNGDRTFTTLSNYTEGTVFGRRKVQFDRVIFLLHGFPDDNSSWSDVWDALIKQFGSQKVLLLAPLLRGYEPSSVGPEKEYKTSDIAGDVKAWIDSLTLPKGTPVNLIGHDWGAITVFKTASLYPDSVTSIVALAIPYISNIHPLELAIRCPQQLYLSSYMITMQAAWLYRGRFTKSNEYLEGIWRYWSPSWQFSAEALEHVSNTLRQPGVLDATTGYYRAMFRLFNFSDRRWLVDFSKVPTLLIGGEEDGCMSKKLYEIEQEKLAKEKNADVVLLDNVGHFLHRENPQKVAELAAKWFKDH